MVYNISCKRSTDSNPLGIRFNKIDEFIRFYDGIRYLELFGSEKFNSIYNKVRYLMSIKTGIHIFSYLCKNQN